MIKHWKRSPDSLILKLSLLQKTFCGSYGRTGTFIQSKLCSSNTKCCTMQSILFLYWKPIRKRRVTTLLFDDLYFSVFYLFLSIDMQSLSPLDGTSCVVMNAASGQWQSYHCGTPLPYICKKSLNEVSSLPGRTACNFFCMLIWV